MSDGSPRPTEGIRSFPPQAVLYYILLNLILIAIGCTLPWLHPALFVVRLKGIDMVDGKVIFVLALMGFVGVLYQLIQKRGVTTRAGGRGFFVFYGVVGLAVVAITGLDLTLFYKNNYPIGAGIYLSFLGGIQLVGCFLKNQLGPPTGGSE